MNFGLLILHCLIERIHSKFINKLPLIYRSKFPFTLTERRRFHTAIQIFKSLHQISPPYLHNIFQFSKDITGHVSRNINRLSLSPECLPIMVKGVSFIEGPSYGTICH